jgi:hypothetical protein
MNEIKTDSIANRIKERVRIKARVGRVGGTDHKKLVILRKKAMELRKKRRYSRAEC